MRHATGRASGNHSLSKVTALALFIASVVVIIFIMVGGAKAHGWFTDARDPVTGWNCCNDRDCKDIPDTDVRAVEGGYLYLPTGEFIPRARVQPSQSYSFARCEQMYDGGFEGEPVRKGDTRCFFEPSGF